MPIHTLLRTRNTLRLFRWPCFWAKCAFVASILLAFVGVPTQAQLLDRRPPQTSWLLDDDGDGAGESVVVRYASATDSSLPPLRFQWCGERDSLETRQAVRWESIQPSGLLRKVWLNAPFSLQVTGCREAETNALGFQETTTRYAFFLRDSIGVRIRGPILWSPGSAGVDTLELRLTEPVLQTGPVVLGFLRDGTRDTSLQVISTQLGDSTTLRLVVRTPLGLLGRDSFQLDRRSQITDQSRARNPAASNSPWTGLQRKLPAPIASGYRDTNHNGAVDQWFVQLAAHTEAGLRVRLPDPTGSEHWTEYPLDSLRAGRDSFAVSLPENTPTGTQLPVLTGTLVRESGPRDSVFFPILDRIVPFVQHALWVTPEDSTSQRYLQLRFSETIQCRESLLVIDWKSETTPLRSFPAKCLQQTGDSSLLLGFEASPIGPLPGDSIRIRSHLAIEDHAHNSLDSTSGWTLLEGNVARRLVLPKLVHRMIDVDPTLIRQSRHGFRLRIRLGDRSLQPPVSGFDDPTRARDTLLDSRQWGARVVLRSNQTISLDVQIFDRIGVFVARSQVRLSQEQLQLWIQNLGGTREAVPEISWEWNGRASNGLSVADGIYLIRFTIMRERESKHVDPITTHFFSVGARQVHEP